MKTKSNRNLKVIDQPEEKKRRLEDEDWEAMQEERHRHSMTDQELDAILDELMESVDQLFIESAFNFRHALDNGMGKWAGHQYLEQFVNRLAPYARHLEKKLRLALGDQYPGDVRGDPDAEMTSLVMDVERTAYVVGVFMGAKLAGGSKETLNLLRKHLIL